MKANEIYLFQANGKMQKISILIFFMTLSHYKNRYFYNPTEGKWGRVIIDPDFEDEMTIQTILEKNVPALYKTQLLLLT